MAVTYYVALPFIRTEDGTAPGEAQECKSEAAATGGGRRNVTRSCQCGGGRIQACGRSERWRVFGRGCTEEVWRCAGRFERAVTMVSLLCHAIDIFPGFTPFSRCGSRRAPAALPTVRGRRRLLHRHARRRARRRSACPTSGHRQPRHRGPRRRRRHHGAHRRRLRRRRPDRPTARRASLPSSGPGGADHGPPSRSQRRNHQSSDRAAIQQ